MVAIFDCVPTSATIPIQPQMTAAFAWAPLMPPRPEVIKTFFEEQPVRCSIKVCDNKYFLCHLLFLFYAYNFCCCKTSN